jgi:hypothetical protein
MVVKVETGSGPSAGEAGADETTERRMNIPKELFDQEAAPGEVLIYATTPMKHRLQLRVNGNVSVMMMVSIAHSLLEAAQGELPPDTDPDNAIALTQAVARLDGFLGGTKTTHIRNQA